MRGHTCQAPFTAKLDERNLLTCWALACSLCGALALALQVSSFRGRALRLPENANMEAITARWASAAWQRKLCKNSEDRLGWWGAAAVLRVSCSPVVRLRQLHALLNAPPPTLFVRARYTDGVLEVRIAKKPAEEKEKGKGKRVMVA